MKLLLLTICAAAMCVTSALAGEVTPGQGINVRTSNSDQTNWVGFAVSPSHRVFQSERNRNEDLARNQALRECQELTQRSCSGIAVTHQAEVVAIGCIDNNNQTNAFLGGSTQGSAMEVALQKARSAGFSRQNCHEIYKN